MMNAFCGFQFQAFGIRPCECKRISSSFQSAQCVCGLAPKRGNQKYKFTSDANQRWFCISSSSVSGGGDSGGDGLIIRMSGKWRNSFVLVGWLASSLSSTALACMRVPRVLSSCAHRLIFGHGFCAALRSSTFRKVKMIEAKTNDSKMR